MANLEEKEILTSNADNTDLVGFLPEGSEALRKYIEEDLKNEIDSDEEIEIVDVRELTGEEYTGKVFLKAAEKGKVDLVIKILEREGSLIDCKDTDGYSALHRASYNGHVDVVKVLLQHGADIASKTENNWQPLHCACRWEQASVASLLLQNGADINAQTSGGHTPLHLAATHCRNSALMEVLLTNKNINTNIENCQNETALDIAKRTEKMEFMFELVKPSVNIQW